MKKEFAKMPENFKESYPGEFEGFSWKDFLTAIPSPLFLVTSYKSNGRENACLQSWSTFVGDKGEYICIMGWVSKTGHLYQTLKEKKCCVLNFPSENILQKCMDTINNNDFEADEITKSGLTAEKALTVNAPRIRECFLNIECEYLWEHENFENSGNLVVALKAKHICMEADVCRESMTGRYGKTGYLYYISEPRDYETGEVAPEYIGYIQKRTHE